MKMNSIIKRYFGILFSLSGIVCSLCSVSCSNEMEIAGEGNTAGVVETISLEVKIPDIAAPATKVLSSNYWEQSENRINSLHVEFFATLNGAEEKIGSCDFTGGNLPVFTPASDGSATAVLTCPVDVYKLALGINAYVRVFANYSVSPGMLTSESMLWNEDGTAKPFFMSGKGLLEKDAVTGSYNSTVSLARQLAKLRVKLGVSSDATPSDLVIDYERVKVQVLHVANFSDATESKDVSASTGFSYIDYPEHTGNTLRMDKSEGGVFRPGGVIDSCYIYENIRNSYDENTTTAVLLTIPSTDPSTGFKETYSQLIKIAGADGYRLKRNHAYTLDVKLRSQHGIDVVAKIHPWEEGEYIAGGDKYYFVYTSGPLNLTTADENKLTFECSVGGQLSDLVIDLTEITAGMNLQAEVVKDYNSDEKKIYGYIRFTFKEAPTGSFSFYVTFTSTVVPVKKRVKITYNHS